MQQILEEKTILDGTWMVKCNELTESPSVLCAFPEQELTMELRARGFCQVLSSETLFSLCVFSFFRES